MTTARPTNAERAKDLAVSARNKGITTLRLIEIIEEHFDTVAREAAESEREACIKIYLDGEDVVEAVRARAAGKVGG